MTDLARQRSARDLWISRSHLFALAAGVVMLVVASFAVGYGMGRQSVELPAVPTRSFAGEAGDDALVELLGRVDAIATPDGGVGKLTFPNELAGVAVAAAVPAPDGERDGGVAANVPPGEAQSMGPIAAAPPGSWTIAARSLDSREEAEAVASTLRGQELEAWVGVELVAGKQRWRASVGGWGSRSEAEHAAKKLSAAIEAAGGSAAIVRY